MVLSGGLAGDDLLNFDVGRTLVDETQLLGGGAGNIDDAVAVERAAVVDTDDDAFAVLHIGHACVAGNREGFVGGGEGIHIVTLAAGSFTAVELVAVP